MPEAQMIDVEQIADSKSRAPHLLSDLGYAALMYAKLGWSVLPLRPGQKTPLTQHGYKDATTDPEQIARWWSEVPDANIGIATGQVSSLVVVDLDSEEAWLHYVAAHGQPNTPVSRTGRGRHVFFAYPVGGVKTSIGKVAKKTDIKSDGGYVVAPPSVHPNGGRYVWDTENSRDPAFISPATATEHQLGVAESSVSTAIAGTGLVLAPRTDVMQVGEIAVGERNDALTRMAGALLGRGLPPEYCLAVLLYINATQCQIPLPEKEVRAIVSSIARREAAKPGSTPRALPTADIPLLLWEQLGQVPDVAWLIDGVLQLESVATLWGNSRAFKSFLAIDMALHVAAGLPWLGRKASRGNVVYLVGEGAAGFHQRAYAAADALGITNPGFAVIPVPCDLTDPGTVAALCGRIAPLSPVLVIVDTYFRYAPGRDHNKQVDHSLFMGGLDQIRIALKASVLVLDHGTKDKDDQRGPGGTVHKFAGYDTVLMVSREGDGLSTTLTMQKQKDGTELPGIEISLRPHSDSLVIVPPSVVWEESAPGQSTTRQSNLSANEVTALQTLADITVPGEEASWSRWFAATTLSRSAFSRARPLLLKRHLVEKVGSQYRLSETGKLRTGQVSGLEEVPRESHDTDLVGLTGPTPLRGGTETDAQAEAN